MIRRIRQSNDGWMFQISHSEMTGELPQGSRLLSGVLTSDINVVRPFLRDTHLDDIKEREFSFSATRQAGINGHKIWIKVGHEDAADLMELMGGIVDSDTKINPTTVYLANTDAKRFIDALKAYQIAYHVDSPIDRATGEVTTVENSRINQFQPYRFDKLLRSYYVGREYTHEAKGDLAVITGIKTSGRKPTEFQTIIKGRTHNPILPLETFSERYMPVVPVSEKDLGAPIDFLRYAHLGEHKLIPDHRDLEYLNCLSTIDSNSNENKQSQAPLPQMGMN